MKDATLTVLLGVAALVGSHIVGAGTMLVLADIIQTLRPAARGETWPWVIVGVVGVTAAVLFLRGAVQVAIDVARRARR